MTSTARRQRTQRRRPAVQAVSSYPSYTAHCSARFHPLSSEEGQGRWSGPKAAGSNSPSVNVRRMPSGPAAWTGVSGPANSARRWRQPAAARRHQLTVGDRQHLGDIPLAGRHHRPDCCGLGADALRDTTRSRRCCPAKMRPEAVRIAAPTRKLRIRGVGIGLSSPCCVEQVLRRTHRSPAQPTGRLRSAVSTAATCSAGSAGRTTRSGASGAS